jgi:TATA-binding protein-associated factor Taf7
MFYKNKEPFFTQEDSISSEESEEDEKETLFVGMKTQDDNHSEDEEEVNLEEEFICAIEELIKSKKQNKLLREQLLEFEETIKSREKEVSKIISELKQLIIELNTQFQETKRK